MSEIELFRGVVATLRARHEAARGNESGVVIADLILWGGIAAATITVVAILTALLIAKANSIPT